MLSCRPNWNQMRFHSLETQSQKEPSRTSPTKKIRLKSIEGNKWRKQEILCAQTLHFGANSSTNEEYVRQKCFEIDEIIKE